MSDRPMAAPGLISYRAQSQFGWVMIGAKNDADAWNEAKRSCDNPTNLQIWNGEQYVSINPCDLFAPVRHFYVTAIDGPRVFVMRGPFFTHQEAIDAVEPTRRKADDLDPRAHFMAWGTSSLASKYPVQPPRMNRYFK